MKLNRALLVGVIAGVFPALPGYAQMSPEKSVQTFKMAPGLEATVWA